MLAGCMPTLTVEKLKEQMPERPVELDKLDMFIGQWEATSEMKMCVLEEPLTGIGTTTVSWGLDRRYLVEQGEYDMGELGKMEGTGYWTYDPKSKKYRTWWFDSYGASGQGTAKYCEKSRTWKFKAKSRGFMGKSIGKGTATFVDDDTIEWTWTERDGTGLFKVMEITGTNKRK
jgi:hypothetical protein